MLIVVTITILGIATCAYFSSRVSINASVPMNVVAKEITMYCLELEDGRTSFAIRTGEIICLAMFVDGMIRLIKPIEVFASGG